MSLQLVLANYLTRLRERNELDALLPELLKAMGQSVRSRAQIGVAQAGVDLLSDGTGAKRSGLVMIGIPDRAAAR